MVCNLVDAGILMGKIFRGGHQNNRDNGYDSGRRVSGGLTYVPPPEQNMPTSSNGNKKICNCCFS